MDITLFSSIVKKLLSDNDRVVIPGLGAFVAEDVPASFSDKGFTINPPYRTVSFVCTGEDDDMLARFYAASNGIELLRARQVMKDFITGLRVELEARKSLLFPEFGLVRLVSQGRAVFVQDENLEIFPHLDYLEPVSLKSLGAEESPAAAPAKPEGLVRKAVSRVTASTTVKPTVKPAVKPTVKPVVKTEGKGFPVWATVIVILLCLAAVALASLAIAGRMYPDFVDQFLYSADQLEILHTQI